MKLSVTIRLDEEMRAQLDECVQYVQAKVGPAIPIGDSDALRWCLVSTYAALVAPEMSGRGKEQGGEEAE